MTLKLLAFQTLNGIGIGMIYFLLAVGLTMIFGLMRFVNFTHGALYMVAAYAAYVVSRYTGSFLLALLIGPCLAALLALGAERTLLRHTYKLPHEAQILITFAIALFLQEAIVMGFGSLAQNVPVPEALSGVIIVADFVYPAYRLAVVAIALLIAIGMWLVIERTRLGATLRAGSESTETVSLLGINVERVFMVAFALGGALAGLAGVLAAPLRGVDPFMAREALSIAFVVIVLGGIGSFTGALVGGLLIGIVQSLMTSIWPAGAQLMIFAAMAAILLARPSGLMGRV